MWAIIIFYRRKFRGSKQFFDGGQTTTEQNGRAYQETEVRGAEAAPDIKPAIGRNHREGLPDTQLQGSPTDGPKQDAVVFVDGGQCGAAQFENPFGRISYL